MDGGSASLCVLPSSRRRDGLFEFVPWMRGAALRESGPVWCRLELSLSRAERAGIHLFARAWYLVLHGSTPRRPARCDGEGLRARLRCAALL
jgi:hypothetical protein